MTNAKDWLIQDDETMTSVLIPVADGDRLATEFRVGVGSLQATSRRMLR